MDTISLWLQRSFFSVVFFVAFFAASCASAEVVINPVPSGQSSPQVVTVATVNVQDIQLLKQEGNVFTIAFNISNRKGVQPAVIYAVELLQKDSKGKISQVDQKIYDNDVLSLGAADSIHKEIVYAAPLYLKGSYILKVEARGPDGLMFGMVQARDAVTLNGTNEYIQINQSGCFLTIDGEKGSKHYTLSQGVDITQEETLTAHCPISNTLKTDQNVIPVFSTHYRTAFGKLVGTEKQDPIILKSGQKTDFTAKLPKAADPQAYDTILTFVNEKNEQLSSPVAFHYVLRGASATIQNLMVDKDYYRAGETSDVTFFWSGSADSFPESRLGSTDTGKAAEAIFVLSDNQTNPCALPLTHTLGQGLEHISIPITRDCQNPVVSAKIVDENGKVLAESVYQIQSKNIPQPASPAPVESNNKTAILILCVLALLLVVALAMYVIKKKKQSDIAPLLFVLVIGLGVLSGGHEAKADTFVVITTLEKPGHYVMTTFNVNLDKSTYAPGETIVASGAVVSSVCENGDDFTGRTFGTLTATINSQVKGVWNSSNDFIAQKFGGSYTAVFKANTKINLTHTGTGSLGIPYTIGSVCTGALPANASMYSGDGTGLTADTPVTYSSSNTSAKCQYSCSSGYLWDGSSCVSTILSFNSNPTSVPSGGTPYFTWATTPLANSCTASGGWSGAQPVTGTNVPQMPIFADTTYTLTCKNVAGDSTARSLTVTVIPPPVVNGACGPASDDPSFTPSSVGLCSAGNPSAVTKNTTTNNWEWVCYGLNGGTDSPTCSARTLRPRVKEI